MHSLTLGSAQKDVQYETRTAVRCLIFKDDKICIVHVNKGNYYKLPGGGVEPEDPNDIVACQREALEETGCEVVMRPELIAQTTEFRGTLHQVSYAYVCTVSKDTGKVELTELEASEGLVHSWCPIEEALEKMKGVKPTTELGEFIQKRDIFLLEAYMKLWGMGPAILFR